MSPKGKSLLKKTLTWHVLFVLLKNVLLFCNTFPQWVLQHRKMAAVVLPGMNSL